MIELKITDDSATGFFKQLAEVAAGFTFTAAAVAHDPVMPEVKAAAQEEPANTKPTRGRKPKAEEAPATEGESAATTADSPTASAVAEKEPVAASPATPSEPKADTSTALDFDKDVAPVVLGFVRSKGKPWVQDILSQFGVQRASEVAPEQYGELVAAFQDAG